MCNILSAGIYRWESEFENKALDKCHLVSWIQLVLKFLQYMYFPNIKLHWIKFISLKKAIRIKIIFSNCWLFAIKMKADYRLLYSRLLNCTIGKSLYPKNALRVITTTSMFHTIIHQYYDDYFFYQYYADYSFRRVRTQLPGPVFFSKKA